MRFANPLFLLLLLIVPALIWEEYKRWNKKRSVVTLPDLEFAADINPSPRAKLTNLPKILRFVALFLFILALARPQAGQKSEEVYNQGIDIMIALDTSSSMQALDFEPNNRLDGAKAVAKEFVKGRQYDRIGVIVFSGFAYTQCPLTVDHDAVEDFIDQVKIGMTQNDGTAIGSAIATAAARLKNSNAKSKVIILLTDGRNNMGEVDPITASQAAAALNIKIYTVGAGKIGGSVYPVDDPFLGKRYVKISDQELDEQTLLQIASNTQGKYFRATDTKTLHDIFKQIDQMEKTDIKTVKYTKYRELFYYLLFPALLLLGFELVISNTWLRKIP
jgi:Ca-activated chloride channel family protein